MSKKGSSTQYDLTAIGAAGQQIATTKYSVGDAFHNIAGHRYLKIEVSSTQDYTLYVLEDDTSFASTANGGAASGRLIATYSGCAKNAAATSPEGNTYYVRVMGCLYVLPVLYQASGSDAAVTINVRPAND